MKIDTSTASFALAFIGAVSGWVAWWINKGRQATQEAVTRAERELNAKRDFNHLANNQLDISKNIANGFEDLEHQLRTMNDQLLEIKAWLIRNAKHERE